MTLAKPSFFALNPWCEIPFLVQPKNSLDRLVDILLWIPHCQALRTRIRALKETNPSASEAVRKELVRQTLILISRLSHWFSLYREEIFGDYEYSTSAETLDPNAAAQSSTNIFSFLDSRNIIAIAYYDSAQILAQHLLSISSSDSDTVSTCYQLIKQHAASVLNIVGYHRSCGIQSGGSFIMIFPLKVICLVTPCEDQRRVASEALLAWGTERGLEGACRNAAPLHVDCRT
jgi:hypothetical protein